MHIRRKATLRVAVIEADILDDPRLSPAALGLYAWLAAASTGGCATSALLTRFGLTEAGLEALLAELREAGHLAEEPPAALPAERRRRPRRKPWIPSTGKVLLRAIADEADSEGCAQPTNKQLAEVTGHSHRTVMRNLSILEGAGLVRRETVDGGDRGFLRLIWVRGSGEPATGEVAS